MRIAPVFARPDRDLVELANDVAELAGLHGLVCGPGPRVACLFPDTDARALGDPIPRRMCVQGHFRFLKLMLAAPTANGHFRAIRSVGPCRGPPAFAGDSGCEAAVDMGSLLSRRVRLATALGAVISCPALTEALDLLRRRDAR